MATKPPRNYGLPKDHIDDAAAAALFALEQQPNVSMQEYMALLVKDHNGKYRRTEFQTQGSPMTSSWTGTVDGKPSGMVHNHPKSTSGDRYPRTHFSDTDTHNAVEHNNRSYITAIDPTKKVNEHRQFVPGETETYNASDRGNRPKVHSQGDELLAEFPIEEQKLAIARRLQMSKMPLDMKRQMMQRLLQDWPEMQTLFMNALTP
jgi:hypothetical protein